MIMRADLAKRLHPGDLILYNKKGLSLVGQWRVVSSIEVLATGEVKITFHPWWSTNDTFEDFFLRNGVKHE